MIIRPDIFKKFICMSILLSFIASCAPPRRDRSENAKPAPTAAPKAPTECELNHQHYESGNIQLFVEPKQTASIRRVRERVIRYTCEGRKYKDKVETIQSPKEEIVVKPYQLPFKPKGVSLFNLDSCDTHTTTLPKLNFILIGQLSAVTGTAEGKLTIKADLAPAVLTFRLKPGLNRIYYTYFEKCVPGQLTDDQPCEDAGRRYSGIYNVQINYADDTLPGVREVRDECSTGTP